jgi:PPM family protein phosphatase
MSQPVDCFGLTDRGKVRDANEDHFVVASMRKQVAVRYTSLDHPGLDQRLSGDNAWLFAVADGVGGRPGGEFASSAAVESLLGYVGRASGCFNRFDVSQENAFLERLEGEIRSTHETILDQHGDAGRAPATTLTLAMLVGCRAYIVHVGDSRAYYLRRGKLKQITRDQTIGEFMVNIGAWTDTQAARAPTASALASAIGGSELSPAIGLIDLLPGDVLLLCTDGLTRHVSDDEIERLLDTDGSAEAVARELVQRALDAGGEDNVTVIVARKPAEG